MGMGRLGGGLVGTLGVVLMIACTSTTNGDGSSDGGSSGSSGFTNARCQGENAKTIANRYFCLPENARCAGGTLPCCTDECESNDGAKFNPDDDPSLYLTCDTKADKCTKKSAGSGGFCGTAKSTTLYSCPPGELQCFYSADGGHCCPADRPYFCYRDKTCYADKSSASQACNLGSVCYECVGAGGGGGGTDPCGAAGTWSITCPATTVTTGACQGLKPYTTTLTVPANVVANGGQWTDTGYYPGEASPFSLDVATCTILGGPGDQPVCKGPQTKVTFNTKTGAGFNYSFCGGNCANKTTCKATKN